MYTSKPTTILRSLNRVRCEITGSNYKPVDDRARRITPVRDTNTIPKNRTRAGCLPTG